MLFLSRKFSLVIHLLISHRKNASVLLQWYHSLFSLTIIYFLKDNSLSRFAIFHTLLSTFTIDWIISRQNQVIVYLLGIHIKSTIKLIPCDHLLIFLIHSAKSLVYFLCNYPLPTAVVAIALLPTYVKSPKFNSLSTLLILGSTNSKAPLFMFSSWTQ